MRFLDVAGHRLESKEAGFLVDPGQIDRMDAAVPEATREGLIALSRERWAVINILRAHFLQINLTPIVGSACKTTGSPMRRLHEKSPAGAAKGACRRTELPKLDGCGQDAR